MRRSVILLIALNLSVYGQAISFPFITVDDPEYVTANPNVIRGLSFGSLRWAVESFGYGANWIPLTWLSLQSDVTLFGLQPAGFHLTNVVLHTLNCVLLLWVLRQLTGSGGKSLVAAALFAVHPLRVESVVWVSERKDVLSAFFGLAAIAAYVHGLQRESRKSFVWAWLLAVCSLLSKQMLVTLPALLALTEWWRANSSPQNAANLDWKKVGRRLLPFVAISAAFSVIAYSAQRQGGGVRGLTTYPLPDRIGNALLSVATYVVQSVWPSGLAIYYPYPESLNWHAISWAAGFVLAATTLAIVFRRKWPFLFFGWGWYLVALLPVIGVIQIGDQARADRYTYIPGIGLCVIAVCCLSRCTFPGVPRVVRRVAVVAVVLGYTVAGFRQCQLWESSESLLRHATVVTSHNWFAETALASLLMQQPGLLDEAESRLRRSIEWKPDYSLAHYSLGLVLSQMGRLRDANEEFSKCTELSPSLLEPRILRVINLSTLGEREAAIAELTALQSEGPALEGVTRELYEYARNSVLRQ